MTAKAVRGQIIPEDEVMKEIFLKLILMKSIEKHLKLQKEVYI